MNARHITLAIAMAQKSTDRFRLGAVLVRRKRPISVGFNQMRKTHPLMERHQRARGYTIGLHAEVHACLGVAPRDLMGADIYVARILRDGRLGIARPCRYCQRFLAAVGVRRAYYTDRTGGLRSMEL